MEKWDSLGGSGNRGGHAAAQTARRHFVLPSSILEEELAGANAACAESSGAGGGSGSGSVADAVMSDPQAPPSSSSSLSRGLPLKKRMQCYRQQHGGGDPTDAFGTSPNSVMMAIEEEPSSTTEADEMLDAERCAASGVGLPGGGGGGGGDGGVPAADFMGPPPGVPEEDESDLEPAELLRRARARLLEDLSTEGAMGEKGVLPLPHSLAKYKEVYNKNGRIGIYTPAERAAIIAKFNSKRSRRVWNKKIRYNCRKNLADRRMRVKGRFVKRSTEQAAQLKAQLVQQAEEAAKQAGDEGAVGDGGVSGAGAGRPSRRKRGKASSSASDDHTSPSSSASSSRTSTPDPADQQPPPKDDDGTKDEDMPDVDDPEAGFCPKSGQPYRRTRRHTIT